MDINKFTTKSQEAMQAAETKAIRFGHMEVDGEHLLLAMLEQPDGLASRLFQKMDIPVDRMRERLEEELNRKPRVSGPGVERGKIYITNRLNRLLTDAQEQAQRLKDEYVSAEHILLAFLQEGTSSPPARCSRNSASQGIRF